MSITRGTIYNVAGSLVPTVTSLLTVPYYLGLIGLDRYGLLALCWLLVGYFNLFDFGVGRATTRQIARIGRNGIGRNRAFWSGVSISAAFALVAMLLSVPLAPLIFDLIHGSSAELRRELSDTIPLLIVVVPVAIIQSVLRGALEGRREFLLVNALFSAAAIGTGGLPLLVANLWGPQLQHLVAATVLVRVSLLVALAIACWRRVPVTGFELPKRDQMASTIHFGAWLTVTNVIGPLMVVADRFLIGAALGPGAVALYVIPFSLVNQLLLVPGALGNALFPSLAESALSPDLNRRALLGASFFVTAASSFAVVLIGPFLEVWIGGQAAQQSERIALVLIVGAWANALAQIPYVSLQAHGRTNLTAKIHLAEVIPYLVLLYLGLLYAGVMGAAIAWSARAVLDFVALAWYDRVGSSVLRRTLFQGIPILLLSIIALITENTSSTRWILYFATFSGLAIYLARILPPEVRKRTRAAMR
jgi:O-antigen/teichoic acid export membrane protein